MFSVNGGSHQKGRRNTYARTLRSLAGDSGPDPYLIDTESALLNINAQHFDRIVIFKGNAKFLGEADVRLGAQYEI